MSLAHLSIESLGDFFNDSSVLMVALHLEKYAEAGWRRVQYLVDIFDCLQIHGSSRRETYKKLRKARVLRISRTTGCPRCFRYIGSDLLYAFIEHEHATLKEIRKIIYGLKA